MTIAQTTDVMIVKSKNNDDEMTKAEIKAEMKIKMMM